MFGFQPIAFGKIPSGGGSCSPIDLTNADFISLGVWNLGVYISYDFNVFNSGSPATGWTIDFVPSGMTFNTSTGIMSGTPDDPGQWTVNFGATNSCTTGYVGAYTEININ